jgi:hypothetical protein
MISVFTFLQEVFNSEDLDSFVNNYGNEKSISFNDAVLLLKKEVVTSNTIDHAFPWSDTEEGYEYWNDINDNFVYNYDNNLKQIEDKYLNLLPI